MWLHATFRFATKNAAICGGGGIFWRDLCWGVSSGWRVVGLSARKQMTPTRGGGDCFDVIYESRSGVSKRSQTPDGVDHVTGLALACMPTGRRRRAVGCRQVGVVERVTRASASWHDHQCQQTPTITSLSVITWTLSDDGSVSLSADWKMRIATKQNSSSLTWEVS